LDVSRTVSRYWRIKLENSLFSPTHLCLTPPLRGNPPEFLDETYPTQTRGMGLLYGKNCMILTSTVFDWSTRVTDRWTDRRNCDSIIIARLACMLSRAKRTGTEFWLSKKNRNVVPVCSGPNRSDYSPTLPNTPRTARCETVNSLYRPNYARRPKLYMQLSGSLLCWRTKLVAGMWYITPWVKKSETPYSSRPIHVSPNNHRF